MPGFPGINPLHKCSSFHCMFFVYDFIPPMYHILLVLRYYTFAWECTHTCRKTSQNYNSHLLIVYICPVESQAADNYAEYQVVLEGGQFFLRLSSNIQLYWYKTASSHRFQSVTNSATLTFCPTLTGLTVGFSHAPTLCSDKNNGLWSEVM